MGWPRFVPGLSSFVMRSVLALVSIGTALIVAWLTYVILLVVPERSPSAAPAWIVIDALALVMVVFSVVWLGRPSRAAFVAIRVAAIGAASIGGWLVATWILSPPDAHSEGYELLIGAWLLAHAIVVALATAAPRRSLAT
jgi:hypothetical protein